MIDSLQSRLLHVVMVIDGQPPVGTIASLLSLSGQTSVSWKLTVTLRHAWVSEVWSLLHVSGIRQQCDVKPQDESTDFRDLLDAGLAAASEDDVALIFPGDVWAQDAVSQLSVALSEDGIAYADEDCLDRHGLYVFPRLKPAFSPEYLLHDDYVGRPLALSAGVVARLPKGSAGVLEARDHDLALRACDVATSVRHIPEVLCHRRISPPVMPGPVRTPRDMQHITAALSRQGERAAVPEPGIAPGTIRIRRAPHASTASIIIPFRDEPRFLRACIDSIDRTKGIVSPEYVLIDNGSVQPETTTLLERLGSRPDVRLLQDNRPFNWAALNNAAAVEATGGVLVFLNNDIEALTPGWLDVVCAQVQRPDVGAVGARLLYPDHRLQHCGVVIGLGGAAGHVLLGLREADPGYLSMAITSRECSAVTGACLATRRAVFEGHGRFDESLGVDLNDIDYCLRLQQSGLRVIYDSTAELVHYESPSRGTAGGVGDIVRFIDRWKESILAGDPYLNQHLTRVDSSCALRGPGEEEWWHRWYVGLSNA